MADLELMTARGFENKLRFGRHAVGGSSHSDAQHAYKIASDYIFIFPALYIVRINIIPPPPTKAQRSYNKASDYIFIFPALYIVRVNHILRKKSLLLPKNGIFSSSFPNFSSLSQFFTLDARFYPHPCAMA